MAEQTPAPTLPSKKEKVMKATEKKKTGNFKIRYLDYPLVMDHKREINSTIMNMLLGYINKIIAEPELAKKDGISILATMTDEAKFSESLPVRCSDKKFMDHTVLFDFAGARFSLNLQKFQEDGQYKHLALLFSQKRTDIEDVSLFNAIMFRSIEMSNVKGSYLAMPYENLAWLNDAKLDKRDFADVFLPKSITEDVELYVKLFEKKERLMRYMMVGMPGTGKTEMTLAIINDLLSKGVTIIKTAPDKAFRDKIELAELLAPSVIVLEDVDMYLGSRSKGGITETLGLFLDVLDGTDKIKTNVGILATTNSVELIDLAAQRPGRFDKILSFDHLTIENVLGIVNKSITKEFADGFKYTEFFTDATVVQELFDAHLTGAHIYNTVKMLGLRAQTLEIDVTSKWVIEEVKKELATIKKIRNTNYLKETLDTASGKGLGFKN